MDGADEDPPDAPPTPLISGTLGNARIPSRNAGILTEIAFPRLWVAQTIPGLGDGILGFPQALLTFQRARQALEGEHEALGVAGLSLMLAAPVLGTAPALLLGGVLADHIKRIIPGRRNAGTVAPEPHAPARMTTRAPAPQRRPRAIR